MRFAHAVAPLLIGLVTSLAAAAPPATEGSRGDAPRSAGATATTTAQAKTAASPLPAKAAVPKPKYGPNITLLSQSHGYIRTHAAPDYWALMPYYVHQRSGNACSLASITMVVNAARSGFPLGADEKLALQDDVVKKAGNRALSSGVGMVGRGVKLDDLGPALVDALRAYGIANPKAEVVHAELSPEFRARLHAALVQNEKSADDFIVANFDQAVYTGDAAVGHIAPVAAYDEDKHQVLIFDPDREWYEPYWVSEEVFLKGMATADPSAERNRGFVWVKIR